LDKSGSNEEIQLVAILRTLKKSQDEIANFLKMRKERVVGIENWLKTAPLELVEGIIDDYHLRQVIENKLLKRFEEQEFQEEEDEAERRLEPIDLVRAAWLTADDILRYYRIDYEWPSKELNKHLDAVKQTAEVWIRLLERLYNFKDEPILQGFEGIATVVNAWSKLNGKPVLGEIEAGTESKYDKQDEVDLYLAASLWVHYEDEFGKLPFSSWKKLTVKDISQSLLNSMRTIAHGQILKASPSCAICKAIRKGSSVS
jgi:hypothetical protein